jgi:hypothetical protein
VIRGDDSSPPNDEWEEWVKRNGGQLRQALNAPVAREYIRTLFVGGGATRRKREIAAQELADMRLTMRLRSNDERT